MKVFFYKPTIQILITKVKSHELPKLLGNSKTNFIDKFNANVQLIGFLMMDNSQLISTIICICHIEKRYNNFLRICTQYRREQISLKFCMLVLLVILTYNSCSVGLFYSLIQSIDIICSFKL